MRWTNLKNMLTKHVFIQLVLIYKKGFLSPVLEEIGTFTHVSPYSC